MGNLSSGCYLTGRSDAKRDMVCVLSCRHQQRQLSLKSSGWFLVPHIQDFLNDDREPFRRETAQVEDLMVNQFDMEPVAVQCMRDVRVVSLAKQMAGLKSSQSSSHVLMKCLPPEVRHPELEDTTDVVFSGDMVGHTQKKLSLLTGHVAMEYVLAFNEAVNLCKLSILKKMIVILQLQDPDAPLPASIVGVKELNKAAETLAGRNDQRVKSI